VGPIRFRSAQFHPQFKSPGEITMSKRIGSVPAALVAMMLVPAMLGALGSMAFSVAARSADNCLTEPNRDPPDGRHWYYRVDQANNRRCWHLGEAGLVVQRSVPETASQAPAAPPAPRETGISRAQRDALFQDFIRWNEVQRSFR
jgi:hypothetical protein